MYSCSVYLTIILEALTKSIFIYIMMTFCLFQCKKIPSFIVVDQKQPWSIEQGSFGYPPFLHVALQTLVCPCLVPDSSSCLDWRLASSCCCCSSYCCYSSYCCSASYYWPSQTQMLPFHACELACIAKSTWQNGSTPQTSVSHNSNISELDLHRQ